ncbi:MAG: hypothetical protein ACR5K7_06255 [Symbiopectobacterium sp.]
MTVHKSQGSEFDHTALVLPNGFLPVLTRGENANASLQWAGNTYPRAGGSLTAKNLAPPELVACKTGFPCVVKGMWSG